MKAIAHYTIITALVGVATCTLIAEETTITQAIVDKLIITPLLFRAAWCLVQRWKDNDKYINAWLNSAKEE